MSSSYLCIISGKVQGVGYRASIQKMAAKAGFHGYVKNLGNGDVEAGVTIFDENQLAQFLAILKQGSSYSVVDNINYKKIETLLCNGFNIKY